MKTLIGKARKRQVFMLSHEHCCSENECFCRKGVVTVSRVPKGNATKKAFVKIERMFPGTLVIGHNEKKVVKDSFLKCPDIAEAIKRTKLLVR